MRKIPTLFERKNGAVVPRYVEGLPEGMLPDQYSTATLATPTRKYDGTCVAVIDGQLYKRYDCKRRERPNTFIPIDGEPPEGEGHWPGWIPVLETPENRWHLEAWSTALNTTGASLPLADGTYELCGPKINGNPEQLKDHIFLEHGADTLEDDGHAHQLFGGPERTLGDLRGYFSRWDMEGIVWWLDGVPVAKIKAKDFGIPRRAPGRKFREVVG